MQAFENKFHKVELVINNQTKHTVSCNYCKEKGHIKSVCPKLKLKEDRKKIRIQEEENKKIKFEEDFPILSASKKSEIKRLDGNSKSILNYKASLEKNIPLVQKIELNADYDLGISLNKQKEQKRQRTEEEEEREKIGKEERKMAFIEKMNREYGYRWFLFISNDERDKLSDEENDILNDYFNEYKEEEFIREQEEEQEYDRLEKEYVERERLKEKKREELLQLKKNSLSPQEYEGWLNEFLYKEDIDFMDSVDDYLDQAFCQQSQDLYNYSIHAPQRYIDHAYMTGILYNYKDKPLETDK